MLNKDLLEKIDKTEEWLNVELGKRDIEKVEDVFCAEWNEKNLWIYPY
ncbi:YetF domain-containing protein [Peptostreptococcus russellii]